MGWNENVAKVPGVGLLVTCSTCGGKLPCRKIAPEAGVCGVGISLCTARNVRHAELVYGVAISRMREAVPDANAAPIAAPLILALLLSGSCRLNVVGDSTVMTSWRGAWICSQPVIESST